MSSDVVFQSVSVDSGVSVGTVSFPAGRVGASEWEMLADLAESQGNGAIYVTSLAQCQVRGGSYSHAEPCATVVATPGHFVALAREIAGAVRRELTVGLDAGDGAILRQSFDVGFLLVDASFHIHINGVSTGQSVAPDDVVEVVRGLAGASELSELSVESVSKLCTPVAPIALSAPKGNPAPIGWLEHDGVVSLGAGIPGGRVEARLARFIAVIEAETTITPWNSLIIHDLHEGVAEQVVKVLAPMGLVFDANSPLLESPAL
ncbi:nitrite/sulfite reductase [Corynebacterium glutamicum]|uniref:nitrite/sulfite reductase n=1 Tax=Corynebacterium glutamicum TaxID=1718 RepID=UPI003C7E70EF